MNSITIGIISCNRFKYLKSLLISLEELKNDGNQIIVADMGSTEPGLRDWLIDQKGIDLYFHDKERDPWNDEYIAKNEIIRRTKNDMCIYIQDDGQLIVPKEYVYQCVEDMGFAEKECGQFEIFGVRRQTVDRGTSKTPTIINGNKYWKKTDIHIGTKGIFRKELFDTIGKYPDNWESKKENWGRSEDWYDKKCKMLGVSKTYRTHIPLFLGIWDDSRGQYAFIRGNKRYGEYNEPVDSSGLYYKKLTIEEIEELKKLDYPLSFKETAKPLGWKVATDETGDMKKFPQSKVMEIGPMKELPLQDL